MHFSFLQLLRTFLLLATFVSQPVFADNPFSASNEDMGLDSSFGSQDDVLDVDQAFSLTT